MCYYENRISDQIDAGIYYQEQYYNSLDMINRITPNLVTKLSDNQIFLFGSNEEGFHKSGAAKFALEHCGAILGQARGLQGQSYAIVTKKNWRIVRSSTLDEIAGEIATAIQFAIDHPNLQFLVTKIATDLAGYTIEDIAPLFHEAIPVKNISLPVEFWDILNEKPTEEEIKRAKQTILGIN